MKIDAVAAALPSLVVTNEDILNAVKQHSRSTFNGDLDRALAQIHGLLRYTGAHTRHTLAPGETPLQLIRKATEEAINQSACAKNDIDLLIYVGVGRGFIEPGGSYLIAQALGMDRVECFDILDACNSWSRAVQFVQSVFVTSSYRRALIISGEFNAREGWVGNPEVFQLKNIEQLAWTFPAYTIGEAATATILSRSPKTMWDFHFSSRPDLADLCTIPLPGYEGFCCPSERIGKNGVMKFTSFAAELFDAARPELVRLFQKLTVPVDQIRAIFPHAASHRTANEISAALGVKHLLWNVFSSYGNLVSSSVPTAISTAISAGRVQRGDLLVGAVASAGMSFAVYSFIY